MSSLEQMSPGISPPPFFIAFQAHAMGKRSSTTVQCQIPSECVEKSFLYLALRSSLPRWYRNECSSPKPVHVLHWWLSFRPPTVRLFNSTRNNHNYKYATVWLNMYLFNGQNQLKCNLFNWCRWRISIHYYDLLLLLLLVLVYT